MFILPKYENSHSKDWIKLIYTVLVGDLKYRRTKKSGVVPHFEVLLSSSIDYIAIDSDFSFQHVKSFFVCCSYGRLLFLSTMLSG